ncbi:MAG: histidine phosphatase family protein [Deinococcales bacterium]
MQRLILVRHGITEWNKTGKFQGHSDVPLSEEGEKQAEALRQRLADYSFQAVYSSPLSRALSTAQVALPYATIIQDARLKELNFGSFEGKDLAENEQHPAWQAWYAEPFLRQAPQGESYQQLRERVVDWFKSLNLAHQSRHDGAHGGIVIAFSHSGSIQMLLSHIIGVEHPKWRKRFYLRHSSLSSILFQEDHAVIESINDARHLEDGTYDPFND